MKITTRPGDNVGGRGIFSAQYLVVALLSLLLASCRSEDAGEPAGILTSAATAPPPQGSRVSVDVTGVFVRSGPSIENGDVGRQSSDVIGTVRSECVQDHASYRIFCDIDFDFGVDGWVPIHRLVVHSTPTSCGNGVCGDGETCSTCATDCGACPSCGDGTCNGSETCSGVEGSFSVVKACEPSRVE